RQEAHAFGRGAKRSEILIGVEARPVRREVAAKQALEQRRSIGEATEPRERASAVVTNDFVVRRERERGLEACERRVVLALAMLHERLSIASDRFVRWCDHVSGPPDRVERNLDGGRRWCVVRGRARRRRGRRLGMRRAARRDQRDTERSK